MREGREAGQREDAFVADIRVGVVETHTHDAKSRVSGVISLFRAKSRN